MAIAGVKFFGLRAVGVYQISSSIVINIDAKKV
jgi:hypothetical protein